MNTETLEINHPISQVKETMQAAVITGPKSIEIKTVRTPRPNADEVLVQIEGSGICASNIPVWEGRDWFEYPHPAGAPGHEGWGHIVALGEGVKGLNLGDRIAFLSYHTYSEYDVAKASEVIKLPATLNNMAFPAEPLACAMNIFKRSNIHKKQTVAIIGGGFLGNCLVQLAKAAGAKVIAISRRQSSLEMAKKNGADEIIPMHDHWEIIEQVKKITEEALCECVIEATGKQWPLDLAGELTAVRGRLIVAGYHQDGLRNVNMQLWNWKGLDVINAHERLPEKYMEGMKAAVEAVEEGLLNPSDLYTHEFQLNEMGDAMNLLCNCPEGFIKAILKIH